MNTLILILVTVPTMAFGALKTTKYHKDGSQTVDFGEFNDIYVAKNKVTTSCRYDNGREVSASNNDYAGCVDQALSTQRMNSLERGVHRLEARTGDGGFEFQLGR